MSADISGRGACLGVVWPRSGYADNRRPTMPSFTPLRLRELPLEAKNRFMRTPSFPRESSLFGDSPDMLQELELKHHIFLLLSAAYSILEHLS